MRCPNCKCEIGNLTSCPYCGVRLVQHTAPAGPGTDRTLPVGRGAAPQQAPGPARGAGPNKKIELYGAMGVCLLFGIFALEIIQLILQLL